MAVRIRSKIHSSFQPDRGGETDFWLTGCGRIASEEWIEAEITCRQCLKAAKSLVDPEKIPVPKLRFGAPETATQVVDAMKLKKLAGKASARVAKRKWKVQSVLREIQNRIKAGTLSNRCYCGKFPWEHAGEKCGPRNAYRRHKLLKLFLWPPMRSLEGSNALVRRAVK